LAKDKTLKPYTVILQFEETQDGYIRCPDLIHVMATSGWEAGSIAERILIEEAQKHIATRDDDEPYESEYTIPYEMDDISRYAINKYFVFSGHLTPTND
jgi:hypothetical protein